MGSNCWSARIKDDTIFQAFFGLDSKLKQSSFSQKLSDISHDEEILNNYVEVEARSNSVDGVRRLVVIQHFLHI